MWNATTQMQLETVIAFPYSGDYRIDVLLDLPQWRWTATGAAATLTFSFSLPSLASPDPADPEGLFSFTHDQRSAVREMLAQLSKCVGLSFIEVDASSGSKGVIQFVNSMRMNGAGKADCYAPDYAIVYMNGNEKANLVDVLPGQYSWSTLIHEIGHALGLKHPGNYNGSDGATSNPGNYLASAEDTPFNTVMSYSLAPQRQERDFFGKYDLLALRYLFGGNPCHTQDNTYVFHDNAGRNLSLIIDDGGVDLIDVSALNFGTTIDLRQGANCSIGITSFGEIAENNISIAFDATIENIRASNFDDLLILNQFANEIDGGGGFDVAILSGPRDQFRIKKHSPQGQIDRVEILDTANALNKDSLLSIESLRFDDVSVNLRVLDLAQKVGNAVVKSITGLYFGYLCRLPDASGLHYWMSKYLEGMSIDEMGGLFYDIAIDLGNKESGSYYSEMSDADFVKLAYRNALGRKEVDAEGLDYWISRLASSPGTNGNETRGTLVDEILKVAENFRGNAEWGWVSELAENRYLVSKYFAVDQGLSFNSTKETILKCTDIAKLITSTDIQMAIELIGIHDIYFIS